MHARTTVLLVAVMLNLTGSASAQQTTGTISGRILDVQELPVPGVTVTRGFLSSRAVSNKISQASTLRSMEPKTRWLCTWPSFGAVRSKISVTALSQSTVAYVYPFSNRWSPVARSVN